MRTVILSGDRRATGVEGSAVAFCEASLAAAAQYLIEYLQRPLLPVLTLHSSNAKYPAFYFSPLIAAIPFVFLYTAFAMIADPDLQPRVVPRDSRLGEWLRPFMPLHFHPREEPQTPNEPGSSLP